MSKKKKLREANEEILNTKDLFVKYAKRYGITLLIAAPIMMIINYILTTNFESYTGTLRFMCTLGMLLLACLIALVIFTKKDDKKKETATKESERDPFAD